MKQLFTLIFIVSLTLGGCGNFLEPKSKSEYIPKDATAMNELLLGEAYPRPAITTLNIFLQLLDDDVTAAPYQELQVGADPNVWWAPYSWQSNLYEVIDEAGGGAANMYKTYYNLILGANAVLDYVDDINDDISSLNSVKAQALALRGFFYFNLVNIYGAPYNSDKTALAVPLKLNSGIEDTELRRNSVEEVYAQILEDLQEAERLYHTLPADEQWQPNTRTSLPMVQLLLSRVYLYMEQWEKAANYADSVMQNGNFRLLDLNGVSTRTSTNTRTYMNYHSYMNSPEVIWVYGSVSDVTRYVYNTSSSKNGDSGHAFFRASEELIACFDSTDLRKERYIVHSWYKVSDGEGGEDNMPQAFGKVNVNSSRYYQPQSGSYIFGRSLRLSEAYLNYCEAKAMLNKAGEASAGAEALRALNQLRVYRFSGVDYQAESISNPDELIAFVRNERRRELCFEDHRWFDLRRWGMPKIQHIWYPDATSSGIVYTLEEKDLQYTMPIPTEAMEANSYLKQNPLAPSPRNGINL